MVSHVLGQTVDISAEEGTELSSCCGFDCASLAEIQLALRCSSDCQSTATTGKKVSFMTTIKDPYMA